MIRTPRLLLIPATPDVLAAELESRDALAAALGVEVPESWPPETYDADAVRWMLGWLDGHPEQAAWGFYYVAEAPRSDAARPRLVGTVGFKGAPDETGAVEIGYSVVPERRRLGYAREAVDGLLARAFAARRVTRVVAHTLPALAPSIGVLRSAGFTFVGAGADPDEPDAIRFELSRQDYDHSRSHRHPSTVIG